MSLGGPSPTAFCAGHGTGDVPLVSPTPCTSSPSTPIDNRHPRGPVRRLLDHVVGDRRTAVGGRCRPGQANLTRTDPRRRSHRRRDRLRRQRHRPWRRRDCNARRPVTNGVVGGDPELVGGPVGQARHLERRRRRQPIDNRHPRGPVRRLLDHVVGDRRTTIRRRTSPRQANLTRTDPDTGATAPEIVCGAPGTVRGVADTAMLDEPSPAALRALTRNW